MGVYFRPGGFHYRTISSSSAYIDRTDIIRDVNDALDSGIRLICLSLPPKSGKTWQLQTLEAYYDESCDSTELFKEKSISKDASFLKHMNKYLAIQLDMESMMLNAKANQEGLIPYAEKTLKAEALRLFPEVPLSPEWDLMTILGQLVEAKEKELFFFLDEWDAPLREAGTDEAFQTLYLGWLRKWFQNVTFTGHYVGGAYMTGILPIQKMSGGSALSDFYEYTVLEPGFFAPHIGFHEKEVRLLCEGKADFRLLEEWYGGYTAGEWHYYHPCSVTLAIKNKLVQSYWPASAAAEALTGYLKLDYEELQEAIATVTCGGRILIDPSKRRNDTGSFPSLDEVLTLLIHLGYLSYDPITPEDMEHWEEKEKRRFARNPTFVFARIPNLEMKTVLIDFLNQSKSMCLQ